MKVHRPATLGEALAILSAEGDRVVPLAGGTDLMVSWHHRPKDDWTLLDLSPLSAELQPFRLSAETLELGALTSYWDVLSSPEVSRAFPLLAEAAQQVGAVQIQTRGTWAGNVGNGSPAADGVPVLMAYDAVVLLQSTAGCREIRLDSYYTGYRQAVRRPDELIVGLRLPRRLRRLEWFHKVGARSAQAITKVGVAVVHDDQGWRVVVNSVAPTVRRCPRLEAELTRHRVFESPEEVRQILSADISPIDDIRSTARYRETVLSRLVYDRFRSASEATTPHRS